MKIVGVITRIGQVGLVVLWMAACSGGGGQSGSDLAMNRQAEEKGGHSSSSDGTTHGAHEGDQAGSSEEHDDSHDDSNAREHDDDEVSDKGTDKNDREDEKDKKDKKDEGDETSGEGANNDEGHESDHSSNPSTEGSDHSSGVPSEEQEHEDHDDHDSGAGENGSGHGDEDNTDNSSQGDSHNGHNGTGSATGNSQDENDNPGTAEANDQSDDSENFGDEEEFPIVTVEDQQQRVRAVYQPQAARFLAVWNDFRGEAGWAVYGRVVNARGGPHGPLKAVSPSGVEHRTPPGLAHDPETGRSLVVWGTAGGDVLARLIDRNGDPSGPVIVVASSGTGEVEPSVAFETTSAHYLVVWIETSPNFVLYARVIDREGRFLGEAAPISEAASGKLDLRLAADHDTGRFLVVWRDYRGHDIYSIFGRMIGPNGLPTSEEIVIADAVGAQINPELAYDARGRSFLVTWSDSRRSGAYELFGQVVASPDGLLVGSNIPLSSDGGYPHAIEVDARYSRYLVVYSKGNRRLYARYLATDGVAEGGEFLLSINEALQSSPHMAVDSSGGILAAWTDERENAPHLFGRLLTASEPSAFPDEDCSGLSAADGVCLDCEADAGALVDGACPIDASASYENHGAYLACVTDVVNTLRHEGRIGGACKVNLIAPRARSGVGR